MLQRLEESTTVAEMSDRNRGRGIGVGLIQMNDRHEGVRLTDDFGVYGEKQGDAR